VVMTCEAYEGKGSENTKWGEPNDEGDPQC